MPKNTAIQRLSMYSGEVRNASVSFVDVLDSGELLTGTVTLSLASGSGMTFSNAAVSTSDKTINGKTVVTGKAVQFKVTAPTVTAKTEFEVLIEVGTDSTPAQTLKKIVRIDVELE